MNFQNFVIIIVSLIVMTILISKPHSQSDSVNECIYNAESKMSTMQVEDHVRVAKACADAHSVSQSDHE